MLADLITQVFHYYNVGEVIISERILKQFGTKISRMEKEMKKAKSGGRQKKLLIEKWSHGECSIWKLKIYYSEVDNIVTKHENDKLKSEKRKLEVELEHVSAKVAKLERNVNMATNSSQLYKKKSRKLSQKLIKMQRQQSSTRGPDKWKTFSDYSKRHQERIRQQLTYDCETNLAFLGLHDFVATEVKVFNFSTEEFESFHLVEKPIEHSDADSKKFDKDIERINLLLYTKDRFGTSNQAYHEVAMLCKDMPRSCQITERIKEINQKWNLSQTPSETVGVQQSIKLRLETRLKVMTKSGQVKSSQNKVRVRLSGDRTNVGKHLHVINITFTILEEGSKAISADGNHLVAVIKVPEDYDHLFVALGDTRNDVEQLTTVCIDNVCYEIEWFLGGDWKFLACICGFGAAHAKTPCIWCKCPLYDHYDGTKCWSLADLSEGARTIKEIQELATGKCQSSAKFNVRHVPLFPVIPLDHVIIDTLHLFLRICDNLINLLILQLRKEDAIDKKKTFNQGLDRSKYKHVAGWEKCLSETLKIPFSWFVCKETKNLKWRDLTGPEKLNLFQNIKIDVVLPNFENSDKIQKLWDDFYNIAELLSSSNQKKINVDNFSKRTKLWLDLFLSLYPTKHVTPYMHALVWHVPEFLNLYGTICPFTQQGLEKLNDKTTKDYFRSTNQRGIDEVSIPCFN